jgi:hypothetical protein
MIDPKKQYRTRDGREVRIYAVDGGGPFSVHGAIYKPCLEEWETRQWPATGHYGSKKTQSPCDLIEVKPRIKREVWVNVYPDGQIMHEQRKTADAFSVDNTDRRIACVKLVIDCEEGEGL